MHTRAPLRGVQVDSSGLVVSGSRVDHDKQYTAMLTAGDPVALPSPSLLFPVPNLLLRRELKLSHLYWGHLNLTCCGTLPTQPGEQGDGSHLWHGNKLPL